MQVRVKICGITNLADARQAALLGADMIGLNFYAGSPRLVDETAARAIVATLPASLTPVALFVDAPATRAQQIAQGLGIGTVQLHGKLDESLPAGMRWIPAFGVRDADSLRGITAWLERAHRLGAAPDAILVDAQVAGRHGGTGQTAPWHLLAGFDPGVPLILAGGLTPDNVAEAIRAVKPFAVDVASGVESIPGVKDHARMRDFIDAVRNSCKSPD
jgi:phosphoribosylanthranilate isomerase